MIILRATRQTPKDWDELDMIIEKLFRDEIYYPLLKILDLPKSTIQNAAESALIEALRSGSLSFSMGVFSGKLNSEIVKELRKLGAKYDRLTGRYRIRRSELPFDLRVAIDTSEILFVKKLSALSKKLSQKLPDEVADKLKVENLFDRKLFKLDKDIKETMKNIAVAPQISDEARKKLAEQWQHNLRLPIRKFTEEQIQSLRDKIQSAYFAGNRYETLYKYIQESFGVSQNKAKFLARQETTLLASKFKETRYIDSGIIEYKWQAVKGTPKHPTRAQHAELSEISETGRTAETAVKGIFRFDNPPVSTEPGKPVRRNNPGGDYNCRCVARPIARRIE